MCAAFDCRNDITSHPVIYWVFPVSSSGFASSFVSVLPGFVTTFTCYNETAINEFGVLKYFSMHSRWVKLEIPCFKVIGLVISDYVADLKYVI